MSIKYKSDFYVLITSMDWQCVAYTNQTKLYISSCMIFIIFINGSVTCIYTTYDQQISQIMATFLFLHPAVYIVLTCYNEYYEKSCYSE